MMHSEIFIGLKAIPCVMIVGSPIGPKISEI